MARHATLVAVASAALISACSTPVGQPLCTLTGSPPGEGGFGAVERLLQACVENGAFPGAVLSVGSSDTIFYTGAVGRYGENDQRSVSDSTVYDLASLTKVIGLTTAVMLLASDGSLDIDLRLSALFPQWSEPPKAEVTIQHLLTHTSGLPAWRPLYLETETKDEALDSVLAARLETAPGTKYTYSDFGAITLGLVVESISGQGLDDLLDHRVFGPLGMEWTRYIPPKEWIDRIAPTEDDPWRGVVVRGEVHDENAARLEGVAGHAGLFSIAPDLARFAQWALKTYQGNVEFEAGVLPISPETLRAFVTRQPGPDGSTRALGWDTPSDEGSSAGTLLSRTSFGHTGFTGTSIWIDPEQDIFIILLTNRVHPTRENGAMRWVRPQVADASVRAVQLITSQ